jgi:hypothetical protein
MRALHLRPGHREEAGLLSDLALRSKGHWGYDQAFLDACRAELTLTPEDILAQRVTVAERDGQVVGFYALAGTPPTGPWRTCSWSPSTSGPASAGPSGATPWSPPGRSGSSA